MREMDGVVGDMEGKEHVFAGQMGLGITGTRAG